MLYFEDFIVGETVSTGSLAVSQDDIVAFASRFDAQDFHVDPDKAKDSFVGTLIASGWHSCSLLMRLMAQSFLREGILHEMGRRVRGRQRDRDDPRGGHEAEQEEDEDFAAPER